MSAKGDDTRERILGHALGRASTIGLGALTIGELARELELSKSGLFAHFQSKERLQIAVLEAAADSFRQAVIQPALQQPRGLARLQSLFDHWMEWEQSQLPGGCLFIAAGAEFDDQPGLVRDRIEQIQREWFDFLVRAAQITVEGGDLKADIDAVQFAFEMEAIFLGFHHHHRLLRSKNAADHARTAWQRLLARST